MQKYKLWSLSVILACSTLIVSFDEIEAKKKITIGAKSFTEQFIMAKMLSLLFQAQGYTVIERTNLLTQQLRNELLEKQIDIYWEYTGTAYRFFYKKEDPGIFRDAQKIYEAVKKLDAQKGVLWLNKASFNNTYALVTRAEIANKHGLNKLSDLSGSSELFIFGMPDTFRVRPDGIEKLSQFYQFQVSHAKMINLGEKEIFGHLRRKQIDIGVALATNPQIEQFNLVLLRDDKSFFPVYEPAPTILKETLLRDPAIAKIANQIPSLLDQKTITHLNYLVEIERRPIQEVVSNWLRDKGVL